MLVFFAIFPPKEVSKKIDAVRGKYDKNYERLAPHITIIPPFVPKKNIDGALQKVTQMLSQVKPIEIQLCGTGNFNKRLNSVIFIDIVDKKELIELQNKMFEVFEPLGASKGKYRDPNFHITIAKRLRLPRLKKINGELEKIEFKDKFVAGSITYCAIEKNEPWQLKKDLELGMNNE